jgi:toxin ParE1/3/4
MKLRYARGALSDLDEIFSYIAEDNPRAAVHLVARIEAIAERISQAPFLGGPTRNPRFRRFPVGNYLIVYEIAEGEIIIQYVRHGARRRPWENEQT